MPVTLNPNVPSDTGESPGLGASRIRALTQAFLDLFNLPANVAVPTPLTITRVGPLTNRTGGQLVAGDIVGLDAANDTSVVLANTQGGIRPYLVALATIANNDAGVFGQIGQATVRVFGAVTRGNYLRKSATSLSLEDTGIPQSTTSPTGTVGVALTAKAGGGDGTVVAMLWGSTQGLGTAPGVSPTASGAANRAAIQAYIDALPASGGILQFSEYGIHIDAAINVTKPLKILGPGTTEVSTPGPFALILDTSSQVGFNVTAKGPFLMQDMSILGTTGTTAIVINGPTGTYKGTESVGIDNVVFSAGAIQIDIRAAIFFRITRCLFNNYSVVGVKVQNTLDGDQGDSTIEDNCVFIGPQSPSVFGVHYLSGGGLKIKNSKFLGNDAAIAVDPTTTATDPNTISDFQIMGCSLEGWNSRAIFLTRTAGALFPANIQICGNQMSPTTGAGTICIDITPAAGTAYDRVIITDNILVGVTAFRLRGVTNTQIRNNQIAVTGLVFDVDSSVVNCDVGPNDYISFGATFMSGTPGAGFLLNGPGLILTVAQLPAGVENSSTAFASDAIGPGHGSYTGYGMTATGGGAGAFVYRQAGAWKA